MYLTYDLKTGAIVGNSSSEPLDFDGYGKLAVPLLPLEDSWVCDGRVCARVAINWDKPGDAMMTVDGGTPMKVKNWTTPTKPGTYQLVAIGGFTGTKSVTVDDIQALKASKVTLVADARDRTLAAGVVTPWGTVQADTASRATLMGKVQMAALDGVAFSMDWRMADNRTVKLNAAQTIQVGKLVDQFVTSTYAKAWSLKADIENARTPEAVRAMVIDFKSTTQTG